MSIAANFANTVNFFTEKSNDLRRVNKFHHPFNIGLMRNYFCCVSCERPSLESPRTLASSQIICHT